MSAQRSANKMDDCGEAGARAADCPRSFRSSARRPKISLEFKLDFGELARVKLIFMSRVPIFRRAAAEQLLCVANCVRARRVLSIWRRTEYGKRVFGVLH